VHGFFKLLKLDFSILSSTDALAIQQFLGRLQARLYRR
jgi:hypothetical protein